MWTISNSPAEFLRVVILFGCLALGGVVTIACSQDATAPQQAPDSPRPAPIATEQRSPTIDRAELRTPVELKSVVVRRPDATLEKLVGPTFLTEATDPLVIEVQTQQALPKVPRNSSPVIVLNGEKFSDTWAILPDKLVAFLPNRNKIKEVNTVAVVWIGNEEATMTRTPLNFGLQDVVDK